MMKLTRRDLTVALGAACATLVIVALARPQAPKMGSAVFDWEKMKVEMTRTGARRNIFDTPTATLEKFESHITTLNAGETPHAPHQHPDEELIIVKDGTVEVMQNGQTQRVGPGSVIFQASNQEHGLRNVGQGQATYYVIRWVSPGISTNNPGQ